MPYLYNRPCLLIAGAARSGTTLLGEVVATHDGVATMLEERLTDVVHAVERLASTRTVDEEGERHRLIRTRYIVPEAAGWVRW